jgi:hypothetical protein
MLIKKKTYGILRHTQRKKLLEVRVESLHHFRCLAVQGAENFDTNALRKVLSQPCHKHCLSST